ncbi:MAG: insulinase family protein, partial [Bacteroidaceae bacterium]|nr:insulinase family protein [Bacteroidaceae bacterium]
SFPYDKADYTTYIIQAGPKQGQTLEEAKALLLEQIDLLRKGEWDESLLKAGIANQKLTIQKMLEENESRADFFVQSFGSGIEWADMVNRVERMEKITKADVVEFANKYLRDNNYAVVYKRQGQDPNEKKIAKPTITPIMTNRDTTSAFLQEIQTTAVTPIEPVFVDFNKDMSLGTAGNLPMLYKKNEMNGLFTLQYRFDFGTNEIKALGIAADYQDYLGTSDMTAAEIKQAFYNLACNYRVSVGNRNTTISISGLAENMTEAMALVEKIITDAQPNPEAYNNLVADILKSRIDSKANQANNFSRLRQYGLYGSVNPAKNIISEEELTQTIKPETLIATVADLWNTEHRVIYYGPMEKEEVAKVIAETHKVGDALK